jgi:hypothetical protein
MPIHFILELAFIELNNNFSAPCDPRKGKLDPLTLDLGEEPCER